MSADGAWKITLSTPMGPQTVDTVITTNGNTFTGEAKSPMGNNTIEGKVDGDTLTWDMSITSPMPMKLEFTATVDGDSMKGNVKLGAFGNAGLTGVRS